MNINSPFQVSADQNFTKVNGPKRVRQGQLKLETRGNGSTLQVQLGPRSLSPDIDQKTKNKTVPWNVFQRKFKQPRDATPEHASSFQMDPAVNRPQVLTPSAVESVRMRGFKEKTECAVAWTRTAYPPPGHRSGATSSTSSTITDLLSKSTLAQRSQSKDGQIGQPGRLSTKRTDVVENARAVGQSAKNAVDQASRFTLSGSQSTTNYSSGSTICRNVGTPMGELLKSSGGEGRKESDEAKSRAVGPNEFLQLYRSRTYSDPRRISEAKGAAARAKQRRRSSESQTTTFSGFNEEPEEQLDGGPTTVIGEKRRTPPSLSNRRFSQNILMELPDTIPEHVEVPIFCRSISLQSAPSCVANSTENQCPSSSSSLSSSSSSSLAAGHNASDRRSRQTRMTDRRYSEPPTVNLQKLSTLRICYTKTMLDKQRDEHDSQNHNHSGSSNSINSTPGTSPKRSTDFPISPESLGIDSPLVPRQHLVIWRGQQSTQILKLPAAVEYHDTLQEVIDEDDSFIYSELMRLHRCWELMPNSSMVVLLDIELKVVRAFQALTVHSVSAAVLWDSVAREVVGMLTVTDFIRILLKYRNSREDLERIKEDKISRWKEQLSGEGVDCFDGGGGLTSVGPDDSLYDVVCSLHSSGFHRLPVIDPLTNNVLYTLGYRRILQFICLFMNHLPRPSFMNKTIWELQVGTFDNVFSIGQDQPLYEALDLLVERRVSALPVVDSEDKVVNIYCRADAMGLAANEYYNNLDVTIGEILSTERESFEGVFLCRKTDSLSQVVEWFVRTNVHRLIVVDDERELQGIVSLSDVVHFLVLHPPTKDIQMEDTIEWTQKF